MDHVLATQGGCFGSSSAKEIRASMELSLMRWRLAKRKAKHLPVLANVSWHVSDLLDDLDSVKEKQGSPRFDNIRSKDGNKYSYAKSQ